MYRNDQDLPTFLAQFLLLFHLPLSGNGGCAQSRPLCRANRGDRSGPCTLGAPRAGAIGWSHRSQKTRIRHFCPGPRTLRGTALGAQSSSKPKGRATSSALCSKIHIPWIGCEGLRQELSWLYIVTSAADIGRG